MASKTLITGGVVAGVLVLYSMGADKQGGGEATEAAANTSVCQVTVAADVLNVRAAPSTSAQIVDTLKQGDRINADKAVQSGFRRIGENRWISARYVNPVSGTTC